MSKLIFTLILSLVLTHASAQLSALDSLRQEVARAKTDSSRVKLLNSIAQVLIGKQDLQQALETINSSIHLSEKSGFNKGAARGYYLKGRLYDKMNEYQKSLECYLAAAERYAKERNCKMISETYRQAGLSCYYLNDWRQSFSYDSLALKTAVDCKDAYSQGKARCALANNHQFRSEFQPAIEQYLRAIKNFEETDQLNDLAGALHNVGQIYSRLGHYDNALPMLNRAMEINKKTGNLSWLANNLSGIGNIEYLRNNFPGSIHYFSQAIKILEQDGNGQQAADFYDNIGLSYVNLHKPDSAIKFHMKALHIREDMQDSLGMAISYQNIGALYSDQGKFAPALEYLGRSLTLCRSIGALDEQKNVLSAISDVFYLQKDFQRSIEYMKLSANIRDSIFNLESTRQIHQMQALYETEKKDKEIVKKNSLIDLQNAEAKQKSLQRNFLIAGFLGMCLLAAFVYRGYKNKHRANLAISEQKKIVEMQKSYIEEKHKEITDSINYAERIQKSFLATKKHLDENLSEYFVLFKPKDVVSGDFYWSATLNNGNFILATADSTGHGVPGAIMSLLNITSLEKAVETQNSPDKILNATRKTIIERLKKDGSDQGGKDGMDCSLISFDTKNKKLYIANANNPVWIVRGPETIEVKGDKMPVGKHDKQDIPFTLKEYDLRAGDVIYTLSDGFPDQFGGEKGKKYMSKNLRELLAANVQLAMKEQKELLEKTFKDWVGDLEQVDDVTVIGIRV